MTDRATVCPPALFAPTGYTLTHAIPERTVTGLICKQQTWRYIALPVDNAVSNINTFAPTPMGRVIAHRKKGTM